MKGMPPQADSNRPEAMAAIATLRVRVVDRVLAVAVWGAIKKISVKSVDAEPLEPDGRAGATAPPLQGRHRSVAL
jgi:hypothetical protein